MSNLEIWTERMVLFFICLIVITLTYAILDTTHSARVGVIKQEVTRNQYPTVPKCDKPMWDRVTNRCKDD